MSCLSFTFLKVGFVHAEDQYWEQGQHTGGGKAYKSVSLGRSEWEHSLYSGIKPKFYCFEFSFPKYCASVCSQDLGISWSRKGQVKIVELLTGCQILFFEGSYGWGQAICSCLGRNWGLWCGENWQINSSWRRNQQSVLSEETELFDENKKLELTLVSRCGTGRRTGGSWSAPTWGWLHLNTKAGLLVGEGTALPPSTYIWQLSIPVCAPFTVFSPRWDGEGFTTNSSSWVGIRDREGQKLPNGEHPAIHWNR